jgi:hypothetical protein
VGDCFEGGSVVGKISTAARYNPEAKLNSVSSPRAEGVRRAKRER